jgi:hypothetical protein
VPFPPSRIGRELEASPRIAHSAIITVLNGQAPYDSLPDEAQAVVRVAWDEQISARIAGLDFEDHMQDAGLPTAALGHLGGVV